MRGLWTRVGMLTAAAVGLPMVLACTDHMVISVESGRAPGCGGAPMIQLSLNRDVDVLFVVDDSLGMADTQTRLAASFSALRDQLESERIHANYRVAITSTGRHDGVCGDEEDPGLGRFETRSCLDRLDEFEIPGEVDARSACTEVCDLGDLHLQQTSTDLDPEPRVRPWIELEAGISNLPMDVDIDEALRIGRTNTQFESRARCNCASVPDLVFISMIGELWQASRLKTDHPVPSCGAHRRAATIDGGQLASRRS